MNNGNPFSLLLSTKRISSMFFIFSPIIISPGLIFYFIDRTTSFLIVGAIYAVSCLFVGIFCRCAAKKCTIQSVNCLKVVIFLFIAISLLLLIGAIFLIIQTNDILWIVFIVYPIQGLLISLRAWK